MTDKLLPYGLVLSDASGIVMVVVAGLSTHFVFRKWEPLSIPIITGLLLVLPMSLGSAFFACFGVVGGMAAAVLIFWTTLSISIVLYRLSPFHPLARYPGPIEAKISKIWTTWVVSQGRQHLYIEQLHMRYGDVVRIGPNELSLRDVSAIQPLMGSQGWPKGPLWNGRTLHNPQPGLIALRRNAVHAAQRKYWNRAFGTVALKEYELIIRRRVTQFVDGLGRQKGPVDFAQWLSFFTYDFMCDMAFGGGTEMLRDGDTDGIWQNMKDGLKMSQIYETIPWLAYYAKYVPGVAMDLKRFRAKCYQRAEERYASGSKVKDLLYHLSNEVGDEPAPPRSLVISEAVLAVIAGSDTTSTALSNTFWCLLRYPIYYKRLQDEVDRYYPSGDDALDCKHHSKMVYLDAVLKEALRLYPAVPSGSQRSAETGTKGKTIGPYYIPQGNQARIHFWSVHRDPRNFSYPERFYPDRWLIAEGLQSASEKLVHNPNAYVPFSFGPANCVGKNLALQEMRTLICHTIQKLNMRFEEDWDPLEWERNLEDRMVYKTGRLPIVVERRS